MSTTDAGSTSSPPPLPSPSGRKSKHRHRASAVAATAAPTATAAGAVPAVVIPSPRPAHGHADLADLPGVAGHAGCAEYATGPLLVSDAALAAAAATNAAAFAAIYRRYGDGLHGFCVGMLRDPDAAADCVHDVFILAATRLGQLREQDKLRPWLYAIARSEALRRIKRRDRERPADQLPDTPDPADGLEHDLARREAVALVTAACAGLSDQDRAVYELHYHQGLTGPELADALGLTPTNANTRVGRLRETVKLNLGALLVARHQAEKCPELAAVLAKSGWDGTLTALLRKRVARHIEACSSCTHARGELVDPRALLASAPIAIPAPGWLHQKVLADTAPIVNGGSAVPAGVGSWWPAGIGISTKTVVAVAAPLAAAAVAVPLALIGLANTTPTTTEPAVIAAAPIGAAPASTTTRRGFAYDTSTTRIAPNMESSTDASPTIRAPHDAPTTVGGPASPAPTVGGLTPTRSGQRRNSIGVPVIPPTYPPHPVDSRTAAPDPGTSPSPSPSVTPSPIPPRPDN